MGVRVKFHKGAWCVFVQFRKRRRAKRIGDRAAAQKVAQRIRERLAEGAFELRSSAETETLEAYGRRWLTGLTANLKASTIRFYKDNLERHVFPALGTRSIAAISRADCRELIVTTRAKGLKVTTVRGIARTLSSLLSQAVDDERLPANPALRMGRYLRYGDSPKRAIEP